MSTTSARVKRRQVLVRHFPLLFASNDMVVLPFSSSYPGTAPSLKGHHQPVRTVSNRSGENSAFRGAARHRLRERKGRLRIFLRGDAFQRKVGQGIAKPLRKASTIKTCDPFFPDDLYTGSLSLVPWNPGRRHVNRSAKAMPQSAGWQRGEHRWKQTRRVRFARRSRGEKTLPPFSIDHC